MVRILLAGILVPLCLGLAVLIHHDGGTKAALPLRALAAQLHQLAA